MIPSRQLDEDLRVETVPAWRVSRAVLGVVALRVVAAVTGLVGLGVLSRKLGPSMFGELSLAFSVALLASSVGELGSSQMVVEEAAVRPHRRAEPPATRCRGRRRGRCSPGAAQWP